MLRDRDRIGRKQRRRSQNVQREFIFLLGGVRRIEENKIERWAGATRKLGEGLWCAGGNDLHAGFDLEQRKIFSNELHGCRMVFHEYGFDCATTERFDADRSGACVQIQKMRSCDSRSQNIEESLT